jgi:hypothetical protein
VGVPQVGVPQVGVPLAEVPQVEVPQVGLPLAELPLAELPLAELPLAELREDWQRRRHVFGLLQPLLCILERHQTRGMPQPIAPGCT